MQLRPHFSGERAQGVVYIDTGSAQQAEVLAGKPHKILHLTCCYVSVTDYASSDRIKLTDGEAGVPFFDVETGSGMQRFMTMNFDEYGFVLSEGNGLWANTTVGTDITVTALGYYV